MRNYTTSATGDKKGLNRGTQSTPQCFQRGATQDCSLSSAFQLSKGTLRPGQIKQRKGWHLQKMHVETILQRWVTAESTNCRIAEEAT